MGKTKKERVSSIIHGAAVAAAAIGAGMAQVPGSDNVPLVALQTTMIIEIAGVYDRSCSEGTAVSIIGTCGASFGGRAASQWLLGWVPGWGNAINASTASAITEAVGWAAAKYFED